MATYFTNRLKQLGLSPEEAEVQFPDPNHAGKTYQAKLFSEDNFGNIDIHYYQLNGAPYVYEKEGSRHKQSFSRKRLKKPTEGGPKYLSPKGQGLMPWFTPAMIEKYEKGEKVQQLNLIEGEFKTYAACEAGIDAIGLGGIHGFYGAKADAGDPHFLHPDIVKFIQKCQVEVVNLCLDADTLVIKWEYDKDLYTRQHSFRTAVNNFYKVMHYYVDAEDMPLKKVFFSHIKSKYVDTAKGLDDLLEKRPKEKDRIRKDLLSLNDESKDTIYFDFLPLDENYYTTTQQYFGLGSVKEFYAVYGSAIGKKQFVYKNAKYVQSADKKSIKFIYHKDVDNFFRIGTDWMKKIKKPNKYGGVDEEIKKFSISEINRDYPSSKFPGFVDKIKKYDAYCNVPDWSDSYNREHNNCYNLSNPIEHVAKADLCPTSFAFLKHIFSGEGNLVVKKKSELTDNDAEFVVDDEKDERYGMYCKHYEVGKDQVIIETGCLGDQFTVGLDWLTIFHRYPKQMLPVPILVSKEYGTGKSTFFKWLKSIYGSNTAILNNEQFKMRFNSHYITKSLIMIDEGFLDVDKKAEKERLKQMVTSDTAYVEFKGVDLNEFPYYGKVLMGSNDADSVMRMDDDENRWFVVKVNPLTNEQKDPDMENKLRSEVGAWLHFLQRRVIAHKREQRLWFKEDYFITEQFKEIVKTTKTRVEHNIDDLLKEYFLTYKLSELTLTRAWLVENLNERSKYKTDQQEVKRYLDKKLGYSLNMGRVSYPTGFNVDDQVMMSTPKPCRHYVFKVENWVDEGDFHNQDEMDAFFSNFRSEVEGLIDNKKEVSVGNEDEDDLPF